VKGEVREDARNGMIRKVEMFLLGSIVGIAIVEILSALVNIALQTL